MSETSQIAEVKGRIVYDDQCPFCVRLADRFAGLLRGRGFVLVPWQEEAARCPSSTRCAQRPEELILQMASGQVFGGVDALLRIARHFWWAWPVVAIAALPGVKPLLRRGYRIVAARRGCFESEVRRTGIGVRHARSSGRSFSKRGA